jgi:hypothetical protein
MGTVITALQDAANSLMPTIGLLDVFATALVLLCLTLSGIIGRVVLWIESTIPRS